MARTRVILSLPLEKATLSVSNNVFIQIQEVVPNVIDV